MAILFLNKYYYLFEYCSLLSFRGRFITIVSLFIYYCTWVRVSPYLMKFHNKLNWLKLFSYISSSIIFIVIKEIIKRTLKNKILGSQNILKYNSIILVSNFCLKQKKLFLIFIFNFSLLLLFRKFCHYLHWSKYVIYLW